MRTMGFDIYGIAPSNEKGQYFRNSGSGWSQLWPYVSEVCDDILSELDIQAGDFNDCHQISADKAEEIGQRLLELIEGGQTQEYAEKFDEEHADYRPFDIENVKEFAEFCRDSGGFEIC